MKGETVPRNFNYFCGRFLPKSNSFRAHVDILKGSQTQSVKNLNQHIGPTVQTHRSKSAAKVRLRSTQTTADCRSTAQRLYIRRGAAKIKHIWRKVLAVAKTLPCSKKIDLIKYIERNVTPSYNGKNLPNFLWYLCVSTLHRDQWSIYSGRACVHTLHV